MPHDAELLTFPKASKQPVRRPRDPRIDAFRGIALVMIFIDHTPGNPYENYTLRNWGFSDAAEAFFIMSGIAAGLAYAGRLLPETRADQGAWNGIAPIWRRSWTLYMTHVFLCLWAVAIFAAGADYFGIPDLLTRHNLAPVFEAPQEALFGLAALGHQIGYVNILPTYSALLLAAPFAIMLGLRNPLALICSAVFLWFAAATVRLNFPNFPNEGGWFFNPFSWQVIFVTGLLIGLYMRRGERLVPYSRALFWLAVGWLALSLVWRNVPAVGEVMNQGMWQLKEAGAPWFFVSHDKTFVALPRLLHVLAMVYVLSCLPVVTRLCAAPAAEPLRLMGRQGLLVFSLGTLMALALQVVIEGYAHIPALPWVLLPLGVLVMIGAAWLADAPRRKAAAARPAPRDALPVSKRGERGAVTA
ncbi:OpgC family protein [Pseudooceanicola sp. LIPI14-2-Ac024]|uniref:OpgC family protein n=1 Tax=Pseudooceanicola sp. LIPI14-2-Ac024 TaxID=3344875 RepID=UPI0035D06A7A